MSPSAHLFLPRAAQPPGPLAFASPAAPAPSALMDRLIKIERPNRVFISGGPNVPIVVDRPIKIERPNLLHLLIGRSS